MCHHLLFTLIEYELKTNDFTDFTIYSRELSFCEVKADVGIFKAVVEWMNEDLLSEKLI